MPSSVMNVAIPNLIGLSYPTIRARAADREPGGPVGVRTVVEPEGGEPAVVLHISVVTMCAMSAGGG
jgi:hypothetical protein